MSNSNFLDRAIFAPKEKSDTPPEESLRLDVGSQGDISFIDRRRGCNRQLFTLDRKLCESLQRLLPDALKMSRSVEVARLENSIIAMKDKNASLKLQISDNEKNIAGAEQSILEIRGIGDTP